MTAGRTPLILLLLGSGGLLLGALGFQYLGGLAPCPLCHDQRWPHIAVRRARPDRAGRAARPAHGLALLPIAAALAVTAGIGAYHAGIEYAWWAGPARAAAQPVSIRPK